SRVGQGSALSIRAKLGRFLRALFDPSGSKSGAASLRRSIFICNNIQTVIVTAQAPPLPLQERQGGLAGPVPPHGVGEKFQCIAALDHTGPGHGEQAGGGYLAVGALVSE